MQVEFSAGVQIEPDRIKLLGRGDLSWLLVNGLEDKGQRELERAGVQFENGQLYIGENVSHVARLINDRPDWARRIISTERPAGEDEIQEAIREFQLSGRSLLDAGLPIASREEAEAIVRELEKTGAVEAQNPDRYLIGPAQNHKFLLQGKARGGGVLELLVMPESLALLDLKASNAELEESESLRGLERAIEERVAPERMPAAKPVPERLSVQPLGGIGELREWQAYIGGSSRAASKDEIERHPLVDWLPAGRGALCRERPEEPEGVDGLRCAVQMRICGRLVHGDFSPQERRLGQLMRPLDLYRPVNPYGDTPAPVGKRE